MLDHLAEVVLLIRSYDRVIRYKGVRPRRDIPRVAKPTNISFKATLRGI
jgi:hypothetical protein